MNTSHTESIPSKGSKHPFKKMAVALSASILFSGSPASEIRVVDTVQASRERVITLMEPTLTAGEVIGNGDQSVLDTRTMGEPIPPKDINHSNDSLQSAIVGDNIRSVVDFMRANTWDKSQWRLLVDAGDIGLRGGDRVRDPNRDLIRGHRYFLARSEQEAVNLSKILREKTLKKRIAANAPKEVSGATLRGSLKENTYTVTRPSLSDEANSFLTDISGKKPYQDIGKMYTFRTPDTDLESLAGKVGLKAHHIPTIKLLMSHIAKRESSFNYGAFGSTIQHKSIHRGHRAIGLVQIMPMNWIRWSEEHFGKILETTDINQEKLGFIQIAKYYSEYAKKGLDLKEIAKHLAIRWYGSVRVNGLATPTEYAQGFVRSVLADTAHIEATVDSTPKETALMHATLPTQPSTAVPKEIIASTATHAEPSPAIPTAVGRTQSKVTASLAANDTYFRSPTIEAGLAKVISLQDYLIKSKTQENQAIGQRLVTLGSNIHSQRDILAKLHPQNTTGIITTQIQLGEQMKQALGTAARVAPDHPITRPILLALQEANTTVINLERVRSAHIAKKEQEQKAAKINAVHAIFAPERYEEKAIQRVERALGLAA